MSKASGTLRLCLLIVAIATARQISAQELGQRVVVVRDRAPLVVASARVDILDRGEVLTVLNTKGPWILVSRGHAGWIDREQLVLLDKALEYFNRALAAQPQDVGLHVARATVLLETAHFDEAIAEASESLRRDPKQLQAYLVRSAAARAKKNYSAAHADAQAAIRLAPAQGYMAAGDTWRDQRQWSQAIAAYTTAIERDRTNPHLYLRRGHARLATAQSEQCKFAVRDFDDAYSLAEYDLSCQREAQLGRATAQHKQGHIEESLAEFTQLLNENRDDVQALIGRGMAYGDNRQYDKAMPDLDTAVWLDPSNLHVHVARATVRQKQYNLRGALKDIERALQLDPNSSEAYLIRGRVLVKQRKWEPASVAFGQAIALDVNNQEAYLARAELYQKRGNTAGAEADRQLAQRLQESVFAAPVARTADASAGSSRQSTANIQRE